VVCVLDTRCRPIVQKRMNRSRTGLESNPCGPEETTYIVIPGNGRSDAAFCQSTFDTSYTACIISPKFNALLTTLKKTPITHTRKKRQIAYKTCVSRDRAANKLQMSDVGIYSRHLTCGTSGKQTAKTRYRLLLRSYWQRRSEAQY